MSRYEQNEVIIKTLININKSKIGDIVKYSGFGKELTRKLLKNLIIDGRVIKSGTGFGTMYNLRKQKTSEVYLY